MILCYRIPYCLRSSLHCSLILTSHHLNNHSSYHLLSNSNFILALYKVISALGAGSPRHYPIRKYSRFQIFRHDIAKKYKIKRLVRRKRPRKFSVRLVFTELILTLLIFTTEAYRAAPFSLQGTTFVLFNYIVPKYLKPTIVNIRGQIKF